MDQINNNMSHPDTHFLKAKTHYDNALNLFSQGAQANNAVQLHAALQQFDLSFSIIKRAVLREEPEHEGALAMQEDLQKEIEKTKAAIKKTPLKSALKKPTSPVNIAENQSNQEKTQMIATAKIAISEKVNQINKPQTNTLKNLRSPTPLGRGSSAPKASMLLQLAQNPQPPCMVLAICISLIGLKRQSLFATAVGASFFGITCFHFFSHKTTDNDESISPAATAASNKSF